MHIRGHHWNGSVQKRNKQKRVNCSHVNKMCPSGYVHVFLCLQYMVSYLWTVGINRLCARMWKMKISHVIIPPTVLIIVFIITALDISLILFGISFLCWKLCPLGNELCWEFSLFKNGPWGSCLITSCQNYFQLAE